MESLKGKKVALTGATGDFGKTFVKDLVQHGCIVYAISRTNAKLKELARVFPSIVTIACDLSKWDDAEKLLTEKLPNDLDILVNNSAVLHSETIDTLTETAIDEQLNLNIKGTLCITKVVAKKMMSSGKGGNIVNISSAASDVPVPFLLTYGMTKAALNRLTKTLANQLGPNKIRVNSVNPTLIPGTTMSDSSFGEQEKVAFANITPLRAFPGKADVSNTLLFLLSDQAKFLTGQILFVDGGLSAC